MCLCVATGEKLSMLMDNIKLDQQFSINKVKSSKTYKIVFIIFNFIKKKR
jgi:hypothetical protein